MDGMTDTVSGPAVPDTKALASTLEKDVVVCVLVVLLD
jgi:hypothetical protein